jgi:hypothetical protein
VPALGNAAAAVADGDGDGDGISASADVAVVAGVHPDRVVAGVHPDRGLVVAGTVVAARPSGAGWEADLRAGEAAFTCRLPDRPSGARVSVTVLDPPYFGPDGVLIPGPRTRAGAPGSYPG